MSDIQCCHQIKVLTGQIPGPMGDVTPEAKEILEANKEQAQIIENKKNEAVTQIDAYTEQSYLNAKSVNIRQFQNFENMKTGQNFTDDLLIATQGFIAAGDGGNAQYYVMPEDSEEEADGYSIIDVRERISGAKVGSARVGSARTTVYKYRKLKLLVPQYVNVRWFGARLDGVTDDSDAFNRAVEWLTKNKKLDYSGNTLFIPSGKMKISKKIELDIGCSSYIFDHTEIDATDVTGVAVLIKSSVSGVVAYNNNTKEIKGFSLKGTRTEGNIGLKYDESTGNVRTLTLQGLSIHDFDVCLEDGFHTYCYTVINCSLYNGNIALYTPTKTDSGERLTYIGCTFFNSDIGVYHRNPNGCLFLTNCSIDYNNQGLVVANQATVFCTDCHFEWNNSNNPQFEIQNDGGNINIKGGYMVHQGQTYTDFAFKNSSAQNRQGYTIDNLFISRLSAKYMFDGGAYVVKNIKTLNVATIPSILAKNYKSFNDIGKVPGNMVTSNNGTLTLDTEKNAIRWNRNTRGGILTIFRKIGEHSLFNFYLDIATEERLNDGVWVIFGIAFRNPDGSFSYNDTENWTTVYQKGTVSVGDKMNEKIGEYVNVIDRVGTEKIQEIGTDELYAVMIISAPIIGENIDMLIRRCEITAY